MSGQQTLIIYDTHEKGGVLAFDLVDLLDLLAPASLNAKWTVTSGDEEFWATGEGGVELEQLAAKSSTVSGTELLALAKNTQQIIWGDLTGFLAGSQGDFWTIIRAVDSSYFEIVTRDVEVIANIRRRFKNVRFAD